MDEFNKASLTNMTMIYHHSLLEGGARYFSLIIRIHEASFNKTKESVPKIKTRKMRPLAQMLRVKKETAVSLFKVTDKEKQTNGNQKDRNHSAF